MKTTAFETIASSLLLLTLSTAANADVENGKKAFKRQCVSCHVVVDNSGQKIAGRSARTGPNLYNIVDQPAALQDGYRYSKALKSAATENALIWDEANLLTWLEDPSGFLQSFTGNDRARAKMSFKVRKTQDAADIIEFLKSVAN